MNQTRGVTVPVELNVGGASFFTTVDTLRRIPHSYFAAMFAEGREPCDGVVPFIDRDPTHFRSILNYYRDGHCTLPRDASALEELATEANFYALPDLESDARKAKERLDQTEEAGAEAATRREECLLNCAREIRDSFYTKLKYSQCIDPNDVGSGLKQVWLTQSLAQVMARGLKIEGY
jgi:hypothetical protein